MLHDLLVNENYFPLTSKHLKLAVKSKLRDCGFLLVWWEEKSFEVCSSMVGQKWVEKSGWGKECSEKWESKCLC